MQLFYAHIWRGEFAELDETESGHCARVLRKKVGDEVRVTDGSGLCCKAVVHEISSRTVVLRVVEKVSEEQAPESRIWIAFAPTKNSKRYEWLLEKCTETGTDGFVPLLCDRNERRKINLRRCRDTIRSAMKQSGRLFLPEITDCMTVEKAVAFFDKMGAGEKYLAGQGATELLVDQEMGAGIQVVFVGPEGDFSERELEFMHQKAFKYVNLGEFRLRTETAGLVAATVLSSLRQKKYRSE
jgi:16S rRNA (uracil1498-N3)-methyltransferase